jgi:ribonuclease HI
MSHYAVGVGRNVGIYNSWPACQKEVMGFPNTKYKKFSSQVEAQAFIDSFKHKVVPVKQEEPVDNTDNADNTKDTKDDQALVVFTDGSCVKGVGGYGVVILDNLTCEAIGGDVQLPVRMKGRVPFKVCTNQIAELYAVYQMFVYLSTEQYVSAIQNKTINVFTDSKYVIGCLTLWYPAWIKNGWKNSKGQPVANQDLIVCILKCMNEFATRGHTKFTFHHVKAHAGNVYNEMADQLANLGRLC